MNKLRTANRPFGMDDTMVPGENLIVIPGSGGYAIFKNVEDGGSIGSNVMISNPGGLGAVRGNELYESMRGGLSVYKIGIDDLRITIVEKKDESGNIDAIFYFLVDEYECIVSSEESNSPYLVPVEKSDTEASMKERIFNDLVEGRRELKIIA